MEECENFCVRDETLSMGLLHNWSKAGFGFEKAKQGLTAADSGMPRPRESRLSDCMEDVMIDLYYWTTPNGHKITIFLEETSLSYAINRSTSAQENSLRRSFSPYHLIIESLLSSTMSLPTGCAAEHF